MGTKAFRCLGLSCCWDRSIKNRSKNCQSFRQEK